MKITITEAHLDAAIAQRWSPETCLMQQALGGKLYDAEGNTAFEFDTNLMAEFDCAATLLKFDPVAIAAIRQKLPVELEVTPITKKPV